MNWRWIKKNSVLAAHAELISMFGGLDGVRDEPLLESALARPENQAAYGNPSAYDLAAAYAYGIARNHPFLDGNKRTAFTASVLFLEKNKYRFEATEIDAVRVFLALAEGTMEEKELALWFENNTRKNG